MKKIIKYFLIAGLLLTNVSLVSCASTKAQDCCEEEKSCCKMESSNCCEDAQEKADSLGEGCCG